MDTQNNIKETDYIYLLLSGEYLGNKEPYIEFLKNMNNMLLISGARISEDYKKEVLYRNVDRYKSE